MKRVLGTSVNSYNTNTYTKVLSEYMNNFKYMECDSVHTDNELVQTTNDSVEHNPSSENDVVQTNTTECRAFPVYR